MIICEKDKELESLKKELEAKNVIVTLPTQPVVEQLNRVCDTKVEGTTLGEPVATMPHPDQNTTQSQLPIKLTGQSLSQSHTDLRDYVPQGRTLTSAEVHPREYVLRSGASTGSGAQPREYVPKRETVTISAVPQTILCPIQHARLHNQPQTSTTPYPVQHARLHNQPQTSMVSYPAQYARLYNPPQITYPFQHSEQIDPPVNITSVPRMPSLVTPAETTMQRQGKAPTIDPFTGENSEIRFDDWLPTLERAAAWNNWTGDELTIQLAGHLRGRALQEWNLLSTADRTTYQSAVVALRTCLDPGNKTLAALDFRHIV